MRLRHHRAARRKRRSGIAARNRKSQRKIARAEHRNRPQRNLLRPQIGPWQRLAVRHRPIHRRIQPAALARQRRKQPKLSHRAPALALHARPRQARTRRSPARPAHRPDPECPARSPPETARASPGSAPGTDRTPPRPASQAASTSAAEPSPNAGSISSPFAGFTACSEPSRAPHRARANQHLSGQHHFSNHLSTPSFHGTNTAPRRQIHSLPDQARPLRDRTSSPALETASPPHRPARPSPIVL